MFQLTLLLTVGKSLKTPNVAIMKDMSTLTPIACTSTWKSLKEGRKKKEVRVVREGGMKGGREVHGKRRRVDLGRGEGRRGRDERDRKRKRRKKKGSYSISCTLDCSVFLRIMLASTKGLGAGGKKGSKITAIQKVG